MGGDEREKTVKEQSVGAMRKKTDSGENLEESQETILKRTRC